MKRTFMMLTLLSLAPLAQAAEGNLEAELKEGQQPQGLVYHVNNTTAPGGDGSEKAPFQDLETAMTHANALPLQAVTIKVIATGIPYQLCEMMVLTRENICIQGVRNGNYLAPELVPPIANIEMGGVEHINLIAGMGIGGIAPVAPIAGIRLEGIAPEANNEMEIDE